MDSDTKLAIGFILIVILAFGCIIYILTMPTEEPNNENEPLTQTMDFVHTLPERCDDGYKTDLTYRISVKGSSVVLHYRAYIAGAIEDKDYVLSPKHYSATVSSGNQYLPLSTNVYQDDQGPLMARDSNYKHMFSFCFNSMIYHQEVKVNVTCHGVSWEPPANSSYSGYAYPMAQVSSADYLFSFTLTADTISELNERTEQMTKAFSSIEIRERGVMFDAE